MVPLDRRIHHKLPATQTVQTVQTVHVVRPLPVPVWILVQKVWMDHVVRKGPDQDKVHTVPSS